MRVILWLLLVLLPGLAWARALYPAEEPPPGFPAQQYIDSRGCVFVHAETGGWQARLARDGSPICGYPPTLSARGLDGAPRLRALDPNAGRSRAELVAEALTRQVIPNLQPGELAGDPRPLEPLPDRGPEPASSVPVDALRAALVAAPGVRQSMAGALRPNLRLCELLGYDGKPGEAQLDDPTRGYCTGLSEVELSRLSLTRPIGSGAQMASAASSPKSDASPPQVARVGHGPKVSGARPTARSPLPAAKTPVRPSGIQATPPPMSPKVGLIPAGARYVQVGTFARPENAERAIRRVAGMGYPVLRGRDQMGRREVEYLIAGPFPDREGIVRALDRIRKAGFRDAFPR
ncbi:SPOR domain-containing protein [Paracoccus kondratievae]|uniref:Sporulation protein n=2 Tax=Paracoccus TaxID=265 RepID=A0AAD3P319_9RHOB|nr:SPOR domain-containing protein [Paracoccus kondratievae]GLK65778.1 sporulation protein [Paracoccus kondratievae]SMG10472.1 Sporulation related domain-containing protein [Paracoccus sp. J56]